MSLSAIRPYFRTHLKALGYTEWTNAIPDNNIPSSILDRTFHLGPPQTSGVKQNQADLETDSQITIALFFKGYRDPATAEDTAIAASETALLDLLKATNRISSDIINIKLNTVIHSQLGSTNDNVIKTEMSFTCKVVIATQ